MEAQDLKEEEYRQLKYQFGPKRGKLQMICKIWRI